MIILFLGFLVIVTKLLNVLLLFPTNTLQLRSVKKFKYAFCSYSKFLS